MKPSKSSMTELMAAIEADRDIELPMDPAFYDRLHDKIMAGIAQKAPKQVTWQARSIRYAQTHARSFLAFVGCVSGLAMAAHMGATSLSAGLSKSHASIAARQEDRLLFAALGSPEEMSKTLLLSQGESEFFVDAAGASFENLSTEKFNRILGVDRD